MGDKAQNTPPAPRRLSGTGQESSSDSPPKRSPSKSAANSKGLLRVASPTSTASNRSSSVTSWYREEPVLTDEEYNALSDEEKARRAYMRSRRNSLRKQKQAAEDAEETAETVEYMSHKRVADVIELSK